jgi:hypothetical protein
MDLDIYYNKTNIFFQKLNYIKFIKKLFFCQIYQKIILQIVVAIKIIKKKSIIYFLKITKITSLLCSKNSLSIKNYKTII